MSQLRHIAVGAALAVMACGPAPGRIDGRFTEAEWSRIQQLSPVPPLPPSPTNRFADEPAAARLGQSLFNDPGFSANGEVSCASCHRMDRPFDDGLPVAVALGTGTRNTPTLWFAAYGRWKMWDGSADSLWAQPILAIENPREHGFSRLELAHRVAKAYASEWEPLFGPLPDLSDAGRFPGRGMPGTPEWEAMAEADRHAVNGIVANFGKAIEAFLRTLEVPDTPFDRYVAGDVDALSEDARDGLALFLRRGCITCHAGPLFTDQDFHNTRTPDAPDAGGDTGREAGLAKALASEFNAEGPFSDDPAARPLSGYVPGPGMRGQFKTPGLRGVALTAPYGHAGTLATLEDVIHHDARGGLPSESPDAVGIADPALVPFDVTDDEVRKLVAFLEALTPSDGS